MKILILVSLVLLIPQFPLSAQSELELSAGYRNADFYDMVYSPNIYAGSGFAAHLGYSLGTDLIVHSIKIDAYLAFVQPVNINVESDFPVIWNGEKVPRSDAGSGYFNSDGFGVALSYSPEFRVFSIQNVFELRVGPELAAHVDLVGTETYCLDYSLGLLVSAEYNFLQNHALGASLSVPLLSLVNRPAYALFDDQIMITWENNLIAEFFHIDKVTTIFSGEFISAGLTLTYVYSFSENWSAVLRYQGYFQYCAFPKILLRLDHNIMAGASLRF
jgi:hypothetical protein